MIDQYPQDPQPEEQPTPAVTERWIDHILPRSAASGTRPAALLVAAGAFGSALLVFCLVLGLLASQAISGSAVSDPSLSPEPVSVLANATGTPTMASYTMVPFPTSTRIVTVTPPKPRTSTPRPKATATLAPIKYKVKAGDTLASIAKKYGFTTNDLIRVNGLKTDKLTLGQELLIPRKK